MWDTEKGPVFSSRSEACVSEAKSDLTGRDVLWKNSGSKQNQKQKSSAKTQRNGSWLSVKMLC